MPLPPRGSAQDEILRILQERERELKFTELSILTLLLAGDTAARTKLLTIYREELFEDAYRPAILRERRANARRIAQEKVDQARVLEKVAKLTAPEEKGKATKKGRRK